MSVHPFADRRSLDLAELEDQRVGDMLLFDRCLAAKKLPGLAVVIGKAFRPEPHLWAVCRIGKGAEAQLERFSRAADLRSPGVGFVVGTSPRVHHRHVSVLLKMMERAFGSV